ncbi:dnaJ homolog subfamily C member 2 [Eurosta solidaginis]|uniref:dnaJ homolog subfamily C member 2 n=1 Tax=Eurosta solidaginis TaxID=178769 RepID=UPI0035309298
MLEFMEVNCEFTFSHRNVERVGASYLNSKRYNANTEEATESNDDDATDKLPEEFAVDVDYLKSLDPKEWKDHDHYAILGLGKLRFNATDDDIRRAYRRMVLMHHPDKRKAKGEDVNTDDDYFTCITKAYEILGTPKTRRAYDSVDPEFDDSFPTQPEIDNNIYGIFNKCFDLNARWSEKKNVPKFGDDSSTREQVEEFYSFWYEFKSWREFSYLDEEDKEKGQDRDERRWIEKENKALRIKRKKEEMMRIRALVDLAYNNDKRIQKFKNEEKERKLAAKRAKMDAAQAQKAEQERAAREAQWAKERAEKAEQKRIEQIRIEKEQQKKALKKERKSLRDKLKESKYYGNNDKETLKNMEGVEKICEMFNINELQELNKDIEKKGQNAFFAALKTVERKITAELEMVSNQQKKSSATKNDIKDVKKVDIWNDENMQLLIKAVNLFPAGTSQRWDVIAAFINQHSTADVAVNARDVLNKAKAMQNSDFSKSSLKTQANNTAFENFNKSKKDVQTCNDITVNQPVTSTNHVVNHSDGGDANKTAVAAAPITNGNKEEQRADNDKTASATVAAATKTTTNKPTTTTPTTSKIWTKEEQALLEQAIKTYPITTPERWDRIAECIPNRSKKDCLRRVKELVELVNSKKEAQQAVK